MLQQSPTRITPHYQTTRQIFVGTYLAMCFDEARLFIAAASSLLWQGKILFDEPSPLCKISIIKPVDLRLIRSLTTPHLDPRRGPGPRPDRGGIFRKSRNYRAREQHNKLQDEIQLQQKFVFAPVRAFSRIQRLGRVQIETRFIP